jgi:hypothetical protein
MALHQNIYWVGKQWAVTGYGIQACNQKQRGKFDIEYARLWEDGVLEKLRAEKWLNVEDFDQALEVARKYHPEPSRKAAPPPKRVLRPKASAPAAPPKPVAPPRPVAQAFHMRLEPCSAKFVAQWRVRIKW